MEAEIAILGAGLTGLNLARRLENAGKEVILIEARTRLGGRIYTKKSANNTSIEMGATWLGSQHSNLLALLDELDIQIYEQFMDGITYFQPFSTSPPQPVELPAQSPNYRIKGGTSIIVERLAESIGRSRVLTNYPISGLEFTENKVLIQGPGSLIEVDLVISTLPPALLINSIQFQPSLPSELAEIMHQTHTWMRDSIKVGVVYPNAFWRDNRESGTLFSNVGPLNESYDHSNYENTSFAMKGFVDAAFSTLPRSMREAKVINQLNGAFGDRASNPLAYEELVWSKELYTKGNDQSELFPHQNNGHQIYQHSFFKNRLIIAGSETAGQYGGYMEGAVLSSNNVTARVLRK